MPNETKRMPLFLLNLTPLPGEPVPLHIFESRYKQMIQDCLDLKYGKKEFGVVSSEHMDKVSCSVSIEDVVETYEDGRLDIMTVGRRRFKVLETFDDQPYTTAEVEILKDPETSEGDKGLRTEINHFLERFLKILGPSIELQMDDFDNAFQMAYLLNLEKEQKRELLNLWHENERLSYLRDYLHTFVPKLEYAQEFKRRVRSNGHF